MNLAVNRFQEDGEPQVTAPPRPNLGPEPWQDAPLPWLAPALIALTVVGAIVAVVLLRRLRKGAARTSWSPPPLDDSSESTLLQLCDRLRTTLAARIGPSVRARTTEELAMDAHIIGWLGEDRLVRVLEILGAGDRIKFADRIVDEDSQERLSEWSSWTDEIARLPRPGTGRGPQAGA